jgi:type II secretory pathway pseudopilin PulG
MIRRPARFRLKDDSGFTLVEVLVTSGLSMIVLVITGSVLLAGLRTQENSRSVTDAANTAQQIERSIQSGVKNASAIAVTTNAITGAQLLIARTISGNPLSSAPSCQDWYFNPAGGGNIYTTKTTPAALIVLPNGGPQGIWTLLGSGVTPADAATGKVFIAPSGDRVELRFNVAAGSHPYVLIDTMNYRTQSTVLSSPCF